MTHVLQPKQRQPQLHAHRRRLAGRLEAHRGSALAENKVLTEFQPHVTLEDLVIHVYEEVD